MNKKILIPIIIIAIIAAGIGVYFIFQKPEPIGKCGDGVCDDFEKANPNLCPKDCKEEPSATTTPSSCKDCGIEQIRSEPLLITIDLHMDPILDVDPKTRAEIYAFWLKNAEWLLDTADKYGAKVSFLSVGEWMESCVADSSRCYPVLRRLYNSGGIIGTHCHLEYRRGANDWTDLVKPAIAKNATPAQITRIWSDARTWIENAIKGAFETSDTARITEINTAAGGWTPDNLPGADTTPYFTMLQGYGYTIAEGGLNQEFTQYFGHNPSNPYKPGQCGICENLSGSLVLLPDSMVVGEVGSHFNVVQNGWAVRKKVEILQALANRDIDAQNNDTKIWVYGLASHGNDISDGSTGRYDLQEILSWIKENLVDKGRAQFVSYIEARDAYLGWEKANPGKSSFDYQEKKTDYSKYPYSEIANKYLRHAYFDKRIDAGASEVEVFQLIAQSTDPAFNWMPTEPVIKRTSKFGGETGKAYKLVLVSRAGSVTTINLSSVFGSSQVRVTRLDTAEAATSAAASVSIDTGPVIVCAPSDCDSILAFE